MANKGLSDADQCGWIWFILGPTASGKTTVAKFLAASLHFDYIEGDDFHSQANIEKMSKGIPLSDADRHDWLLSLRDSCRRQHDERQQCIAVAVSALKQKYRDTLRELSHGHKDLRVAFIYLHVHEDVLRERAAHRHGHYAGQNLVHSQMDTLEPPTDDEIDVVEIDAGGDIKKLESDVVEKVRKIMGVSNPGPVK
ncbi:P-loop containing nucleoside triphosphate hydrolase protein [Dactylonectria macrodidyma]|uniref:Gluconokinase n=1 Tax=Dactylonectria macrodidyma TaxID=307937 RepID=A0A9P9JKT2_9HYPO|nr:P-loop containing nucleoside triphosphate hydrolase protein [Dactylonectria macrodidyma]